MEIFLYKILFFLAGIVCSILIFVGLWKIIIKKAIEKFRND